MCICKTEWRNVSSLPCDTGMSYEEEDACMSYECVQLAVHLAQGPKSQKTKGVGDVGSGEGERGRKRGKERGPLWGLRS